MYQSGTSMKLSFGTGLPLEMAYASMKGETEAFRNCSTLSSSAAFFSTAILTSPDGFVFGFFRGAYVHAVLSMSVIDEPHRIIIKERIIF
jgi:hypothetical protein